MSRHLVTITGIVDTDRFGVFEQVTDGGEFIRAEFPLAARAIEWTSSTIERGSVTLVSIEPAPVAETVPAVESVPVTEEVNAS